MPFDGAAAPKQSYEPTVIDVQVIPAARAAEVLRRLYPGDRISVEDHANAVIVVASPADVNAMRQVITGIDVKSPTAATVDAIQVHGITPTVAAEKLRAIFKSASIQAAPNHTIVVTAGQQDMTQIKSVLATIDTPPEAASPRPEYPSDAVRISQTSPRTIARVLAKAAPHARVAVSGNSIVFTGPQDEIDRAKQLAAQLDQPAAGIQYTQVYRLRFVDADSVADLLRHSFSDITVQVDKDLNALTVFATYGEQRRIADAVSQLDANPMGGAGAPGAAAGTASTGGAGDTDVEVVSLHAAVPGANGAPSTSASDIAQTVSQALQSSAPDLHVTVPPNSTQLVLTGSEYSIKLAKRLIDQLDVAQPLVVLDTEILEVDETVAKNLGLEFASPVISSTFNEVPPAADENGFAPPLMKLQKLERTPISFGLQVNLLVQKGQARILADPRISVISGRTANIRAGDTIAILTTTGGGSGTVATTQLQTFQTGVTLDITPVVNSGNYVTVTLHPTVNSLEGILNGVPQIANRDTETTVGLAEDQTLVIGGLIQDTMNRTDTRIPILGDLPLVGKLFRNNTVNGDRNELIVTVTPHVVRAGEPYLSPGPPLPNIPAPQTLPTLPPGATLPPPSKTPVSTPVPYAPAPSASYTPAPAPTLIPSTSPAPSVMPSTSASAMSSPHPTPSAMQALNVYTSGQVPTSNYKGQFDPPQIFYVQFQPTLIHNNTPVTLNVVTSTNVQRLTMTYQQTSTQIAQTSPGVWQSTWNFSTGGGLGGPATLTLNAYKNDGSMATQTVPVTITP